MAMPNASVDVLAPTETPTATPTATDTPTNTPTDTPTATPTRTPGPRYFPRVDYFVALPTATPKPCIPSEQTVDVVLVIDTSSSMSEVTTPGGPRKIDAAIDAGLSFLDNLKLPPGGNQDQVAVVWFNGTSGLESPLTGDKASVQGALRRLTQRQAADTRIDLGLATAYDEIVGARHRAQNNRAVVLVTDGRQDPTAGDTAVLTQAGRIKAAGVTLWTVGLGTNVDVGLLTQTASSPDNFKLAPDAGDLRLIYEEIARVVPCRP
jgi:uncharacterized protein (DUF58 family)